MPKFAYPRLYGCVHGIAETAFKCNKCKSRIKKGSVYYMVETEDDWFSDYGREEWCLQCAKDSKLL